MESTPLFTNQLALMAALLEATRSDYFSSPDARRGDIVAGANGGNFTFRNNGAGIPFGQMARAISAQVMIDSAQIASRLNSTSLLDSLGYTPATVFCMIIPNTYEVYWNISADALISRLVKERDRFWTDQRKARSGEIGLTEQQVITLASIVEEETSKSDEMPVVAGLYMNRLKKRMPLQADPTVIFALGGERPKRVLKKHLEVDSPYNTYKYAGLPPAPIRFVSTRAIDAVLNYRSHNYLYMCAKEDFSGYHNFTSSLTQHNANAARYQRALRNAGIR